MHGNCFAVPIKSVFLAQLCDSRSWVINILWQNAFLILFFFPKLITIFPYQGGGTYPLLSSASWDFDEGHCTGWKISVACREILGRDQQHCRLLLPLCFQRENDWWHVSFISLRCILNTVNLNICWKSNAFRLLDFLLLPSLPADNHFDMSVWNGLTAHVLCWMTKLANCPSGICWWEIHQP